MRPIALVAFAVAAAWAFGGCASDTNTGYRRSSPKPDGGTCIEAYCPVPMNGGIQCCVNNHCGYDLGRGCVETGHTDGG